jgi:hypothetical protein
MTYNFDPDRWYANERGFLEQRCREEGWSEAEFDAALADLERRYHQLVERLDGTYQLPGKKSP